MNLIINVIFLTLTVILTRVFVGLAKNTQLMDKPNERSMHTSPTVRGGGIVFIGLTLISMPLLCYLYKLPFNQLYILFVSSTLLAGISFLDDFYSLPATLRFVVHCLVAFLIVVFMRPSELNFIFFSLTNHYLVSSFLFITTLGAINHFNFMDGIDGFCASQALFIFVAYAILFGFHDAVIYQNYCLIFIACLLGFLIFNFPPAQLFMGDVGSTVLGLTTFAIAVIAQQKFQIPILYWFLLNGVFLVDATITLVRRILKKEKWSSPHKKHAYQRLKQGGADNRMILLGQLLINCLILVAVLMFNIALINLSILLLVVFGILLVVYYLIEKRLPMFHNLNH